MEAGSRELPRSISYRWFSSLNKAVVAVTRIHLRQAEMVLATTAFFTDCFEAYAQHDGDAETLSRKLDNLTRDYGETYTIQRAAIQSSWMALCSSWTGLSDESLEGSDQLPLLFTIESAPPRRDPAASGHAADERPLPSKDIEAPLPMQPIDPDTVDARRRRTPARRSPRRKPKGARARE